MFVRFFSFPPNLFYAIADAMRPHLAPYDRELHVSVAGKRCLDYVDVTAVMLRRLQIGGLTLRFLEQDFAIVASVLSGAGRVIDRGRRALFEVMTGGSLRLGLPAAPPTGMPMRPPSHQCPRRHRSSRSRRRRRGS